jgi:hypothetical protein
MGGRVGARALALLLCIQLVGQLSSPVIVASGEPPPPTAEWSLFRAGVHDDTLTYVDSSDGVVHASSHSGIYAFEVRDDSPVRLLDALWISGEISPIFNGLNVDTLGDYVYMVDADRRLHVLRFDKDEGYSHLSAGDYRAGDLAVAGQLLYVTYALGDESYLQVLDLSSPSSPVPVGRLSFAETVSRIWVIGSRAYVSLYPSKSVGIVDLRNTTSPVLVATIPVGSIVWGIEEFGGRIVVTADKLLTIDVTDTGATTVDAKEIDTRFGVPFAHGDYLYIGGMRRDRGDGELEVAVLACGLGIESGLECSEAFGIPTMSEVVDFEEIDSDTFVIASGDLYVARKHGDDTLTEASVLLVGATMIGGLAGLTAIALFVSRQRQRVRDGSERNE